LERDEVAKFEYDAIWKAVDQRYRDVWPMGGFLIGTGLLSMAYAAVNLRLMGFHAILVLSLVSIIVSAAWLLVYWRQITINDKCLEYLRNMEKTQGRYVGIAQSLMNSWSKELFPGRFANRRAFYFVLASLIVAWIALLIIKYAGPN